MADVPTITWEGQSGKTYKYWIYKIGYQFDPQPANYIFIKETKLHTWQALYIGETSNLSERFDNHHKMSCIRQNEATHICAHKSDTNETTRLAEESDLIANWKPICNN